MGTTEELFHVLGITTEALVITVGTVFDFDGADGAQGAFIAEDKIDIFMVDEAVSFVAVLGADFVAEEGIEADLRENIETLTKNIIEELETASFYANHEVFFGAIAATIDSFKPTTASGDADQN